ncbi:hypothetical protein CW751_04095 [Brumimicrobium salinarum]|uniref:Lipocalin-like domain-containing protein n=1 Tax=Brumimicrobium salinarum TaxID=2058658 RepID=A0A2I0R552_9FLAO|nr:hypothetical protein [Brumimicrobium salinarum]PKR81716.1 hypothetical protein CW751_04095 [Brumimicrobium salinarum]
MLKIKVVFLIYIAIQVVKMLNEILRNITEYFYKSSLDYFNFGNYTIENKKTKMKFTYYIILGLIFFSACINKESEVKTKQDETKEKISEQDNTITTTSNPKITHQWILISRTNTEKDKTVMFNTTAPSIITQFEENGFFSTFDYIEIENDDNTSQKLEPRSSGQWEIHNDNELVMRHNLSDSAINNSYIILELNDENLIIKNSEKDMIDTYKKRN